MYCTNISWEWLAELGAAVAARCCKCPNAGGSYIVPRAYRPLGRNTVFAVVVEESHSSTFMAPWSSTEISFFPGITRISHRNGSRNLDEERIPRKSVAQRREENGSSHEHFRKMEPHVVGASPHTSWVSRAEAFTPRAVLQQSALPAVVFLPMSSDFTIKRGYTITVLESLVKLKVKLCNFPRLVFSLLVEHIFLILDPGQPCLVLQYLPPKLFLVGNMLFLPIIPLCFKQIAICSSL
ncbi:hypothetical protein F5882DRAFT_376010 [Hyaloscypha sp. PMI_1271]|nr:hypothetical protein F5882DRAFT_376010 [Hyaloscypha sp. PMI_1271]